MFWLYFERTGKHPFTPRWLGLNSSASSRTAVEKLQNGKFQFRIIVNCVKILSTSRFFFNLPDQVAPILWFPLIIVWSFWCSRRSPFLSSCHPTTVGPTALPPEQSSLKWLGHTQAQLQPFQRDACWGSPSTLSIGSETTYFKLLEAWRPSATLQNQESNCTPLHPAMPPRILLCKYSSCTATTRHAPCSEELTAEHCCCTNSCAKTVLPLSGFCLQYCVIN